MTEQEALAKAIVDATMTIATAIRRTRVLNIEQGIGDKPHDATAVAGYLAKELLALGARLPDGNPHKLRWPFAETPRPLEDPKGLSATVALVSVIVAALKREGGGDPQLLEDVAAVWPECRNKAEADAAMVLLDQGRVHARDSDNAAAHAQRMEIARKTPPAPRSGLQRIPDLKSPRGEGEWVIGDDFSDTMPRVG